MGNLMGLVLLLLGGPQSDEATTQVGIATRFFPKEKHNNGKFACAGRTHLLPRSIHTRWKDESMPICAHRSAPCGSWIRVENLRTKDVQWCLVADRGPYGAVSPSGKWVLKSPRNLHNVPKRSKFRAVIDLSPYIAAKLNTKGYARVRISWWPRSKNNVVSLWHSLLDWAFVATWN